MCLFAILICLGSATSAAAQAATPAPITAGWQDGFVIQSANGDYRLNVGMTAQADGRFSLDDPSPFVDTFTLRKIRPTFTGRIARYFDYKIMPDLGGGQVVMQDAYLDLRFSPKFRVRMGKDKEPVGYELLIGDPFVLFPERSLATGLVPNRDNGVQLMGDLLSTRLSYSVGVFNGIPDGTSSTTELDTNNGKDILARAVVQPFRTRTPAGPVNGLGFHIGVSHGKQAGALPVYRTSATQTYYSYATGVVADGTRTRVSPAVFYYYKSFGGFAEYMLSRQDVSKNTVRSELDNQGWNVTASYVVTGENATDRGVRPTDNFDPASHHWGALQLLFRYASLTVDDEAFSRGLAAATASRIGHQLTVGANWYPAAWIKYYGTFERTTFDEGAPRPTENAVIFRAQIAF
jgi:phosphate-selective porin OprO/OprP